MLALGLLLTACGRDEEEPPRVTAAQQCDGTLSPAAAGALESVLGAKKFSEAGSGGLDRSVNEVIEDQAREGRPPGHRPMCRVSADAGPSRGVEIDFRLYEKADLYDDGTKWTAYGRYLYGWGREASSDNKTARLFVGCTSPRLKGSDEQPTPIESVLSFEKSITKGTFPANTPATREAYLTVLHSVTLAVVKELGCENNAGLPEKPVFEVKQWRGEQ
ncbi:hypothetical protein [Streptomyces sp. NBC_00572]|uniref:hypothetical protein n=1 Tax=Streptomyces sp. NBC_00572 TaxID=2903664 RepID=UPI0022504040|nr:hypothetical protein [Streptomyces sp. NBC_00572]MCX4981173.1 hypothetical protein [Streptomyces sp. NBC_00572]